LRYTLWRKKPRSRSRHDPGSVLVFLVIAKLGIPRRPGRAPLDFGLDQGPKIMTMPALRLYEKLRLYQPLGFLFEPGATMPQGATAEMPSCLLCGNRSHLPPANVGWLRADDETRLFLVCADCDCPEDELERRIVERVSEPVAA
jgi:hypothetical protein